MRILVLIGHPVLVRAANECLDAQRGSDSEREGHKNGPLGRTVGSEVGVLGGLRSEAAVSIIFGRRNDGRPASTGKYSWDDYQPFGRAEKSRPSACGQPC